MAQKRKSKIKDDGLKFITDKALREGIRIAIGFSSYLVSISDKAKNIKHKGELHRVVILYVASVVEALCLFLIEKSGLQKEKIEHKYINPIKIPDCILIPEEKFVVVALQEKITLSLTEIPFVEAIGMLKDGKIITSHFAQRLHKLREKRNSQHLYGRAFRHISAKDVNSAFSILQNIFNIMKNKKLTSKKS